MTIAPAEYHAYSSEYSIDFTFSNLSGAATAPALSFLARATDVRGNVSQTVKSAAARGDVNGDGAVSPADIFYLVAYLFAAGPGPIGEGDVNSDSSINTLDVFYLSNFLFANGAAP